MNPVWKWNNGALSAAELDIGSLVANMWGLGVLEL